MRLIFLFIFLISSSFALSVDKNWYENKKEDLEKLYSEQATKIASIKNSSPEDKEQVDYQLVLLKKLQSILKEENTFVFNCNSFNNVFSFVVVSMPFLSLSKHNMNVVSLHVFIFSLIN